MFTSEESTRLVLWCDWTYLHERAGIEHAPLLLGKLVLVRQHAGYASDVLHVVACCRTISACDIYEDDLLPLVRVCLGGEANFAVSGAEKTDVVSIDGCTNKAVHVAVGVFDINDDGSHEYYLSCISCDEQFLR